MNIKSEVIVAVLFCLLSSEIYAQDEYKYSSVVKYDENFKGIGPKVYNLPSPKSKEERLIESYKEKSEFEDSIVNALNYQELLDEYKLTSNSSFLRRSIQPFPTNDSVWNMVVQRELQNSRIIPAIGLLNEYAFQSLSAQNTTKSVDILKRAIGLAHANSNLVELGMLQVNLANIYMYTTQYGEAAKLQEAFLAKALSNKSNIDQANSWVKIALVQAYRNDFALAENTIIRKAIPLYNRAKSYSSKIAAWQQLARIYQMEDKHTEAQWFLIQARDLAKSKNLTTEAAEIEYMLGSSKIEQKNYAVALQELRRALELAQREENQLLELAIQDKLGNAYIGLGQYDEAEDELEKYWQLRNSLFLTN